MLSEIEKIEQISSWLDIPAVAAARAHVPGLAFRSFQGEEDFPRMVAVITASKDADRIERVDKVEDVARVYAHLTNCDPFTDMVFAMVNEEVVGYSRVTWLKEEAGRWVYVHFGFLKPAWRRCGIGQAMLKIDQQRLRLIAAGHLREGKRMPDTPAVFQSWASDSETGAQAMLANAGYQPVRFGYTMVRPDLEDIPDLPLPSGIEVRPVDWQSHKRQIFLAEAEAFRDHWGYSVPTEEDYQGWLADIEENPDIDPALWRIAWQGDQLVGQVRSYILPNENEYYGRQRGWTEDISVGRPWRRQGVARALIALSLKALKARGMQEAALHVDTQNPTGALKVYEFMGFHPVKVDTTYEHPLE
jgi:mycothiol synthase